MKTVAVLAAAVTALALSGCGTISRGSTETWAVNTDPSGALVRLSTGQTCTTPCSLTLPRKQPFIAHVERDSYAPVDATVGAGIGGAGTAAMFGNILAGGIIGLAVDAGIGANMNLTPNPLHVALVPLPGATPAAPPTAYQRVTPPPAPTWSPAPAPAVQAWAPPPPATATLAPRPPRPGARPVQTSR